MAAPLTEAAIQHMRDLIASGALQPGARLPPEAELALQLGASRNTVREAVRALVTARVLDVRRGDGTYVTSLGPELLLEGIAFAADMMHAGFALELVAVRRILEPAATAMAAHHADGESLGAIRVCLERMRDAGSQEILVQFDAEFHALVARASGNATLASTIAGVSSGLTRARIWRGIVDHEAVVRTITQHAEILAALEAQDAPLAEAAALVHVATTETWLREVMAKRPFTVADVEPRPRPRDARAQDDHAQGNRADRLSPP